MSRHERAPDHLWAILRPRVEQVNLGHGIERIGLLASRTGRMSTAQGRWWEPEPIQETQRDLGQVMDLLRSRLGPDGVVQASLVDTHVPEAAFRYGAVAAEPGR